MLDDFAFMGVNQVKIGETLFDIPQPKSRKTLKGYGDTIKVGDVVFITLDGFTEGPVKITFISATDTHIRWLEPNGSEPSALYAYEGLNGPWQRSFKKADKATTKKLNDSLKFFGLHVRLSLDFNTPTSNGSYYKGACYIPACWVAWCGDFKKAYKEFHSPYGFLKKKNIVSWVKSKLYRGVAYRKLEAVDIPEDFPVTL